ncbi:MAG: M48 family metalloprotease [Candidatus Aminicenantes bacterium]|nr:MAG: M48 family metalloprotease [Candidatus Aminicenantes bacterium]
MAKKTPSDFYEIQSKQRKKSVFLILFLFLFYFFAIGFISVVCVVSFGLILSKETLLSADFLKKILLFDAAVSIIIATFHYVDARRFGAKFILKRLDAHEPDLSDRYHQRFANTVDEMRIASGLPKVIPHVIPSFAVNSMAVISADDTPNVLVTEGLLAEFTRDEIQAVVAHELAHILRGDTFYITLVCSLANFFERLRQAIEPDTSYQRHHSHPQGGGAVAHLMVYLAVFLSNIIMHLLSTLISRQREILADAAAVELSRNPKALGRAIYKAHLKNSFVGDFNVTYSPLFIVPPESTGGESDGFFAHLFNSHPPLMRRVRLLANMLKTRPARIIQEVWEIQKKREKARTLISSREEMQQKEVSPSVLPEESLAEEGKVWSVQDRQGNWEGPYSLEGLLSSRSFYPLAKVKNLQEEIEARAREFPQIRDAIRKIRKRQFIDPGKQNKCPRCRISLQGAYYEGVPIKICPQCSGKLVNSTFKERIITRKELKFSEHLTQKAREFKDNFMQRPFQIKKIALAKTEKISCPSCGSRMVPRPYSLHYVIPVDKCMSCHKVWFDADELEILQILIEER